MTEKFVPHGEEEDTNDIDARDEREYPRQFPQRITWEDLNQDFNSLPRDHKDVEQIAKDYALKHLDLRPYMIERPFTVCQKDNLEKVHQLFREMHMRQLMVIDSTSDKLIGIITRQDLFQYMSL